MKKLLTGIIMTFILVMGLGNGSVFAAQTNLTKKVTQNTILPSIQMKATKDKQNAYYLFSGKLGTKFTIVVWINDELHSTANVKIDRQGFLFITAKRSEMPKGHYQIYAVQGNIQVNNTDLYN